MKSTNTTPTTAKLITLDGQTRDTLNAKLANIKRNASKSHKANVANGADLASIREEKLYIVDGKESFKEWYDVIMEGDVYGIGYKQANQLINAYLNVWSVKELKDFPLTSATRLASTCKTEEGKKSVINLVKKGILNPSMSYRKLDDVLKAEGLMQSKKTEGAPSAAKADTAEEEELKIAIAKLDQFMNNCKKADTAKKLTDIFEAWETIKNAHAE